MPEEQIGVVTHFFGGPSVAVVKIERGEIRIGDTLRFLGHTTDFTETVRSMEIEHERVEHATAGQEVAIQVKARVRHHDRVLKVT